MRACGLIFGPDFHYLDHLAPLCSLEQIPLVVTEEKLAIQAHTFYPDLEVIYLNPIEAPERITRSYDRLITCMPRPLFDEIFFFPQTLNRKKLSTLFCPHGNSDKGRNSPFMEALKEETVILTYGERMEAFLREKQVDVPTHRIGNFRLAYYLKHLSFYSPLLPEKRGTTILYAPTWQDREKSSSFPYLYPFLLKAPAHHTLLIRLHPHLYLQYPEEIAILREKAPPHLYFLDDFPPVYPILAMSDLYIGDASSVGYDFLYFKRPMLLLKASGLTQLHPLVEEEDYPNLFDLCDIALQKKPAISSLYEETFAPFSPISVQN